MKVILTKNCKDGKINEVIDVSDGYATNFLIKNKFAVAYNAATSKILNHKLSDLQAIEFEKRQNALQIKEKLENEPNFKYELITNIDANGNLNVHGSVSAKHILKDLESRGYELSKSSIDMSNIKTLGLHTIKITLYKDIKANIIAEVRSNE